MSVSGGYGVRYGTALKPGVAQGIFAAAKSQESFTRTLQNTRVDQASMELDQRDAQMEMQRDQQEFSQAYQLSQAKVQSDQWKQTRELELLKYKKEQADKLRNERNATGAGGFVPVDDEKFDVLVVNPNYDTYVMKNGQKFARLRPDVLSMQQSEADALRKRKEKRRADFEKNKRVDEKDQKERLDKVISAGAYQVKPGTPVPRGYYLEEIGGSTYVVPTTLVQDTAKKRMEEAVEAQAKGFGYDERTKQELRNLNADISSKHRVLEDLRLERNRLAGEAEEARKEMQVYDTDKKSDEYTKAAEIYKIAKDRVTEIEARKTDATSDLEQLQKDRVSKTLSGVSMEQRMKYIERSLNVLYSSGSTQSIKVRKLFAHLQEALKDGSIQEQQKAERLINQMYLRYYINERGEKSEAK